MQVTPRRRVDRGDERGVLLDQRAPGARCRRGPRRGSVPTSPAPATTTFMARRRLRRPASEARLERVRRRRSRPSRWSMSPSWPTRSRDARAGHARPCDRDEAHTARLGEVVGDAPARTTRPAAAARRGGRARSGPSTRQDSRSAGARRNTWSIVQLTRRHRRDAEALVDLGPPRVVDAGDDVRDLVGLAGDPGGEDVGVVAARHRRQRVGPLGARPARDGRGRSRTRPPSARPSPSGRRRNAPAFLSMMATLWPSRDEPDCEPGTDPAAADDDDVHRPIEHVRIGWWRQAQWRSLVPRSDGRPGAGQD